MSSDNRVLKLREIVKQKEASFGVEPKAKYKTNLKYGNTNLLTQDLTSLVSLLADVLYKQEKIEQAEKMIGCETGSDFKDLIEDIVLRGKILKYKEDKADLDKLTKQLDNLRSEELKKSDSLDELEKLLK